jgi:hypothetical protein
MKVRDKMQQLFGYSPMKMPWGLYLANLNEAGKITGRSTLEILTVILDSIEEIEKKSELTSEIKPIKKSLV